MIGLLRGGLGRARRLVIVGGVDQVQVPVVAAGGAVGVDFGLSFAEPASGLAADEVRNATRWGADAVRSGDRVGVASLLGGPAGFGDAVGVGEDVGQVIVRGVQVGVLGAAAVAVGPAEVVRWVVSTSRRKREISLV